MKYFLDTEFIEKPNTIQLISIGIVADDGSAYYAVSSEYKYNDADDWVKENVIDKIHQEFIQSYHGDDRNKILDLVGNKKGKSLDTFVKKHYKRVKHISQIKQEIIQFIGNDKPEFWGYYADYDWVIFCWIFGKMIDLPRDWPMYCNDLKQLSKSLNAPKFPEPKDEHNALSDAKWNKEMYAYLKAFSNNDK